MGTDIRRSKGSKHTDSEEDWGQLSDKSFRRRIQNRISQRKHRAFLSGMRYWIRSICLQTRRSQYEAATQRRQKPFITK
jgi:hypothetical protein